MKKNIYLIVIKKGKGLKRKYGIVQRWGKNLITVPCKKGEVDDRAVCFKSYNKAEDACNALNRITTGDKYKVVTDVEWKGEKNEGEKIHKFKKASKPKLKRKIS